MNIHFAASFIGALFAIMNPFSNLPVFLAITDGAPVDVQRKIALKAAVYCLVLGSVFAVVGQQVLNFFGINVNDFRVAGGLLVLLIGLNMLNGHDNCAHHGTEHEKKAYPASDTVAFYPLTFPILVGPGTITTLILFSHEVKGVVDVISYGVVFCGLVALMAAVFWNASAISKHLSNTMRAIMNRLMGMILAAIAVSMITEGLKVLWPGLT